MNEIVHRLKSPACVYSELSDSALAAISPMFPSRFNAIYRAVRPYTMGKYRALLGLYNAVNRVANNGVDGDVVECGIAGGGSAALLGITIRDTERSRALWLYDTFEGLPAPTHDDPDYDIAVKHTGRFAHSTDEIKHLLEELGVRDVHIIPGMFQHTVALLTPEKISVLHIDGDWYDSVKACLELYDRVSPGGVIQFDDYGYWASARKAVDEFLNERGIPLSDLRRIDFSARQLIKRY